MKWLMRIVGALMLIVGLVPLTPLMFLLVLVHGSPGGVFAHIHLQFWQTQLIGAGFAGFGARLLYLAQHRP